jgi:transposase
VAADIPIAVDLRALRAEVDGRATKDRARLIDAARAHLAAGRPERAVAADLGISRQTLRVWVGKDTWGVSAAPDEPAT